MIGVLYTDFNTNDLFKEEEKLKKTKTKIPDSKQTESAQRTKLPAASNTNNYPTACRKASKLLGVEYEVVRFTTSNKPSLPLSSICTHPPSPRQGDRCHYPCGRVYVASEAASLPVFSQVSLLLTRPKSMAQLFCWQGSHLKVKIFNKFNTSQRQEVDTRNVVLEVQ